MKYNMEEAASERHYRVKKFFRSIFDIREDMMSYDEMHEMMEENTIIHGSNMWILIMAILIASIGLNVNSTAVIIGAMLISPLMSGILTMGYSLATSNLTMLRKAFTRFLVQVFISLTTSTIYFRLSPLDVPTSEMIARTSPTLWDVLIAIFGGIAGGIGNTRKKKGNVIPGVAIATALMPPLCTTGYGIATLQPKFILGAFYLFTINTLFIMLSVAFVTKLLKVPSHNTSNVLRQKRVKRLIAVITVMTVIPSILIGGLKVYQTVIEQKFTDYVSNEFVFSDTQVVQSEIDVFDREISISLVGAQISDEVIERLEDVLNEYSLGGYAMQITQNKSTQGDDTEKITIAVQENTIQELQKLLEEQQEKINELNSAMTGQIDCKELSGKALQIFTKLSECSCGVMSNEEGEYILLIGTAAEQLSLDEEQVIKNWLITESGLTRAELRLTY